MRRAAWVLVHRRARRWHLPLLCAQHPAWAASPSCCRPVLLQSSLIHPNSPSCVAGQQAATTRTLAAMASSGDEAAAAAAAGGSKRPASPAGATEDDAKRQRLNGAAAAGPSGGEADPLDRIPDSPMHLLRVRGIPRHAPAGACTAPPRTALPACRAVLAAPSRPAASPPAYAHPCPCPQPLPPAPSPRRRSWGNEGFLGVKLADLVRGPMKWVLASNYMMDLGWLLSACPDLARAERLLLVHGERAGGPA